MEKEFLEKVYGNISYNSNKIIRNIGDISSISIDAIQNLTLKSYIIALDIALAFVGAQSLTKNAIEVQNIYNKIIKDFNKLNKIFDLEDPIEIFTMYNYLLYKGYLSKDKVFEFRAENVSDIKGIYGANVVSGKGVCRHISVMLRDIYRDNSIESNSIPVNIRRPIIELTIGEENIRQSNLEIHEFLSRHLTDESQLKEFNELNDVYDGEIDLSYRLEEEQKNRDKSKANHLITMAIKKDKSYFLDPTHARIYRLNSSNSYLEDFLDDKIKLCPKGFDFFERKRDLEKIKENILLPSVSLEEENKLIDKTKVLCGENQDILETFYNEHSEMYNELSSKIMLMRK